VQFQKNVGADGSGRYQPGIADAGEGSLVVRVVAPI